MLRERLSLSFAAILILTGLPAGHAKDLPNIMVIMADDVGYSDIGCYGSEISTPNLDQLAANGVRFTQFYNTARCCPSRAALMTGVYPHQAGVGHMLGNTPHPGYKNKLSTDTVTMAEVLKDAGYRTYMTGKWHLSHPATADAPKDGWPMQRGFEKFYGTIMGGGNYYYPLALCRGNKFISADNDPGYKPEFFYYTDAITDNSITFLDEHTKESSDKPFFMYIAYTAAHWPLHAPEDEIRKYDGKYDAGYDAVRHARFDKMKKLGIVENDLQWSPTEGDWKTVDHKDRETAKMETYAAMVTRMDKGIGEIVEALKSAGQLENTIIMFMQDNGACAEEVGPKTAKKYMTKTADSVKPGVSANPGGPNTFTAYGENWANVSNTPFRRYKHWVHEGGISTPLIFHWPKGMRPEMKNGLVRDPGHLIDVMATAIDAAETTYPEKYNGNRIAPLAGESLLPLVHGEDFNRQAPIYWEHEGNRAVRDGKWKLVAVRDGQWELYDMSSDRAEMNNLADAHPGKVQTLASKWQDWALKNDVLKAEGQAPGSTTEKIKKRRKAE